MSKFKINLLSEVAGDGSQDVHVDDRDMPFHVTADWLKQQAHTPEEGDFIIEERNKLTLEAAPRDAVVDYTPPAYKPETLPNLGTPVEPLSHTKV